MTLPESITAARTRLEHIADHEALHVRFNDLFDVKAYGATGDGVTDDATAIQAAIDAVGAAGGGAVVFPTGVYIIGATLTITDHGVWLVGPGSGLRIDAAGAGAVPKGAVLRAKTGTALDPVVQFGVTTGADGGGVQGLVIDGQDLAVTCLTVGTFGTYVIACEIRRATTQAIKITGNTAHGTHACRVLHNHIMQNERGIGIYIEGRTSAGDICGDNVIIGNHIAASTVAWIKAERTSATQIFHNHFSDWPSLPSEMTCGIDLVGSHQSQICDNWLDQIGGGPSIRIRPFVGSPSNIRAFANNINDNHFYAEGLVDNTHPCILLDATGEFEGVQSTKIDGNFANTSDLAVRWTQLLKQIDDGANLVVGTHLTNNRIFGAAALYSGTRPAIMHSNSRALDWGDASIARTENALAASLSGNGSATTFNVAHGLDGTPRLVVATPTNAAARDLAAQFHMTKGTTNVTFNFASAPASGTYTYDLYVEL